MTAVRRERSVEREGADATSRPGPRALPATPGPTRTLCNAAPEEGLPCAPHTA